MCLAVPAKVVEKLPGEMGIVEIGGVRREISLELLEQIDVGDYVIVHVGYALRRIDAVEAAKTIALIDEIRQRAAGPVW